jgi:hypothetical protein
VVILHGGDATNFADAAITIANLLAVVGSPAAFKDMQAMAIIGAMKCARGAQRTVFRATGRIISPFKFSNELYAPWAGAFGPSIGFLWVHVALVLFLLRNVKRLKPKRVIRIASKLWFPSVSLFIAQMLHVGVTYYSIELIKIMDSAAWTVLAVWALIYTASIVGLVIFWSIADTSLEFKRYSPAEFARVPPMLGVIIPFGYWAPDEAAKMTRWVIGDFRVKRYAGFEYIVGVFIAALASYLPDEVNFCVPQYGVMSAFFILCSLIVVALRPFRSNWANFSASASNIMLSVFMVCATLLVNDPYGPAHTATNTVRWAMTALVGARGLIGIGIYYLEWKLVSQRRQELDKEQKRIQSRNAITNILADDDDEKTPAFSESIPASTPSKENATAVSKHAAPLPPSTPEVQAAPAAAKPNPLDERPFESTPVASWFPSTPSLDADDDHTLLASLLNASPNNSSIYRDTASPADELARRQRLMRLLDQGPSSSAGLVPRGGGAQVLPDWI